MKLFKPSSKFFTDRSKVVLLFVDPFLLFMFRVCHAVLYVHCSPVFTCLERANLLALLYVVFSSVLDTFPCGVLGQVWYLIVSFCSNLTYIYA